MLRNIPSFLRNKIVATDELSPRAMSEILDNYIIGQDSGKRAVCISLRNRWRKRQLADEGLKGDIVSKNILLIGSTGVGKTEIARRIARITNAPFIKVEATKYTEVGFRGKDVDTIIEDLYGVAKRLANKMTMEKYNDHLSVAAEDTLRRFMRKSKKFDESIIMLPLNELLEKHGDQRIRYVRPREEKSSHSDLKTTIEYYTNLPNSTASLSEVYQDLKRVTMHLHAEKDEVQKLAKKLCEEDGIVFIDEIDKIVTSAGVGSGDISDLGVQQDLLPLIEGSNIQLKKGETISTHNILFICAGAFHMSKVSDMIAELQGRLPVRVELKALTQKDFRRILTEPEYNLVKQQIALLLAENIKLSFSDKAISRIAEVAAQINHHGQNIGARRLSTVIERVVDEYSFNCDKYEGKEIMISDDDVNTSVKLTLDQIDLAKYLL